MSMTAGDPVSVNQLVPPDGVLEIKPRVGAVWMVKNVYCSGKWELYRSTPTTTAMVLNGAEPIIVADRTMIATSEIFFRVKNKGTSPVTFGFDGLVIQ